jgi:hypothetical protein
VDKMGRQHSRELQKLYKFANNRDIVIEEVDQFSDPHVLGKYCGRFGAGIKDNMSMFEYFGSPQDIHIQIKKGLNPARRIAVIAHEIGHDKNVYTVQDKIDLEQDAWEQAKSLLCSLGIKIRPAFHRLHQAHIEYLRKED